MILTFNPDLISREANNSPLRSVAACHEAGTHTVWAFAYNSSKMLGRLVAVFSLLFVLSAGLSALGLSVDPRSVTAGETHLLFDLDGQDLADKLVKADADPDSPDDNLLLAELSDWPDVVDRLLPFPPFSQGLELPRFFLATLPLPWPYLAALQRPPCLPV